MTKKHVKCTVDCLVATNCLVDYSTSENSEKCPFQFLTHFCAINSPKPKDVQLTVIYKTEKSNKSSHWKAAGR